MFCAKEESTETDGNLSRTGLPKTEMQKMDKENSVEGDSPHGGGMKKRVKL